MIFNLRGRNEGRVTAALVAVSSLVALVWGGQQAVAADSPPLIRDTGKPFVSKDPTNFKLISREVPGVDTGSTARAVIAAAEAKQLVTPVSPLSVAEAGGHSLRDLCHEEGLNATFKYDGFCWDNIDDSTSAWAADGGWHPQGFTTSNDADPTGARYGGDLSMASWYYGDGPSDAERSRMARISVAKSTPTARSYGHVLLVQPTGSQDNPSFSPVTDIHADGIAWYEDRLFVANGGELQIYDLNHLWKVNSAFIWPTVPNLPAAQMKHEWVLPMVARYSNRTKDAQGSDSGRNCVAVRVDPKDPNSAMEYLACLSALSVDHSDRSQPALISGGWKNLTTEEASDVIRWPLAGFAGESASTVAATAAYSASVHGLQGVATDGTHYYLSAVCDTGYAGDANTVDNGSDSCIWQAEPGGPLSILTRAPRITQNLSYSFASGRLWGMNEVTGFRVVFSLLPRAADDYRYLRNEYSTMCAGAGNKVVNSTAVIQWDCNDAQDERWQLEETKDNSGNLAYFIRNTFSGKCMGTASSLVNGGGVIQYTCNAAVDEKWWYDPVTHALRNVYSGKCLGLGAGQTRGSKLIQWTCNGAQDERWTVVAITSGV
ncbi:RICIN domain-containing protein [Streptomyces zaomyceticus]|uniref:RICIN domain-containing protein n=1 Tax=Streptomyces zaomyceticus TaxID=68286 RepID=UPI00324BD51E